MVATAGDRPNNDLPELKKAAADFEALLIGQLVASARKGGGEGWLGAGEDQAGGLMVELAEQELGRALAGNGGMGIAKLVVDGLKAGEGKRETGIPADKIETDEQRTTQTGLRGAGRQKP